MYEEHTSSSQVILKWKKRKNIKKEQLTQIRVAFSAETKGQAHYELQEL